MFGRKLNRKQKRLKEKKQKSVRKRKNFFLTLVLTLLLWGSLTFLVYFIDPEEVGAVPTFFVLLFFAVLFTFSTIFANSRRGFLTAVVITIFAVLRYFGVGNLINLTLVIGLAIVIEIYLTKLLQSR